MIGMLTALPRKVATKIAANSALVKPIASKADSVTPTNRKTRVSAKSVESMMNRTMPCRRKTGKLSDVVARPARLAHEIRHEILVEIRAMTSRKIRLLHKVDEFYHASHLFFF